jgi:hypothetical protein
MSGIRSGAPPRGPATSGHFPSEPVRGRVQAGPAVRKAVPTRPRPDPRPLRIAFGMVAVAATSALATVLVSPGGDAGPAVTRTTVIVPAPAIPPVRHVVQYVRLKAGQTAPPSAAVTQAPAPAPRVVVVTTRQSGTRP